MAKWPSDVMGSARAAGVPDTSKEFKTQRAGIWEFKTRCAVPVNYNTSF